MTGCSTVQPMARPGPGPSGKDPLSRERILRAALDLVDRDGLDALTMRRLGGELGVEAMTLYHYVPNKEAILDGMFELILGEVDLDPRADRSWRDRVEAVALSFRAALHAHPNAVPVVASRPIRTPAAMAVAERLLGVLVDAGFGPIHALYLMNAVANVVIGAAVTEIGVAASGAGTSLDQQRRAIDDLPAEQFPVTKQVVAHANLEDLIDTDAQFRYALDVFLDGVESRRPRRRTRR
jgi:TetR/AcrR family transcriptional regulator, tetracycline repressor protein